MIIFDSSGTVHSLKSGPTHFNVPFRHHAVISQIRDLLCVVDDHLARQVVAPRDLVDAGQGVLGFAIEGTVVTGDADGGVRAAVVLGPDDLKHVLAFRESWREKKTLYLVLELIVR